MESKCLCIVAASTFPFTWLPTEGMEVGSAPSDALYFWLLFEITPLFQFASLARERGHSVSSEHQLIHGDNKLGRGSG